MKRIIYSMSVVVALTSCDPNSSSSSGPKKSQEEMLKEADAAKDYTKEIQPNVYTVVKANLTSEEEKETYTFGCKYQGKWERDTSALIDPALTVGQTFKEQWGSHKIKDDDTAFTKEKKITSIKENSISKEENFEKFLSSKMPFATPDRIFLKKPHLTRTVVYFINENGYVDQKEEDKNNIFDNFTSEARDYYTKNLGQADIQISCEVQRDAVKQDMMNNMSPLSKDKINYNFNDKMITAYLAKYTNEGEVICTQRQFVDGKAIQETEIKVSMGHGKEQFISIYSNQIVQMGQANCGGNGIYYSSIITLDSGKIISSSVNKVLSAPTR